jgi:hypothetical protein
VWHDWSANNASTGAIPEDWDAVRGTCKELMPDWGYTVCCANLSWVTWEEDVRCRGWEERERQGL